MEDTIVFYSTPEHLNTMSLLAKFISKNKPSVPIIILCSATAATSIAAVSSISYHRLPAPVLPPNFTTNPIELVFELPRLNNPNLRDALQEISQKARIRAFVIHFFCHSAFEVYESENTHLFLLQRQSSYGHILFVTKPSLLTLEKRVRELMEWKMGRDLRRRVSEMKSWARAAVADNGSSVMDLQKFLLSTTRDS